MSKKLLLADDSITIQKVIQITFAHEDYELTITDNGDAALSKAREIRPDLVMSDIYMPGKNGYELTSALKQDPALRHIPVLLLAGSFEPFDEDKAKSCKADAWIEKPFESQSLIDKVAELLSAAQVAAAVSAPVEAVAEVEPDTAAPDVLEETLATEPSAAAEAPLHEDPFGDISFEDEEEAPAKVSAPAAAVDDWSDFAVEEAPAVTPAAEDVSDDAVADAFADDDFTFSEELPMEEVNVTDDFAFAAEELDEPTAAPPIDDFAFTPEASVDGAAFAEGVVDEDEIMPLGDDDILGAEDLEPLAEEQTLSAWSRDTLGEEDVFTEPLGEPAAFEPEPVAAAPEDAFAATPAFAEFAGYEQDEPPLAASPEFSAVEFAQASETPPADLGAAEEFQVDMADMEEPAAPLPAAGAAEVEKRAAAIGEDEIERIIESVVSRIVEKLAGSILERVAWEVVPDLAEGLIREEIRRIKEDAA